MERLSFLLAIGLFLVLAIDDAASVLLRVNDSCACGEGGGGISNRIIGGFEAMPHEYPWVVPIFKNGRFFCGGSLINDRYVLTAGHCVTRAQPEEFQVGLGYHNIKNAEEGYMMNVIDTVLHEDYGGDDVHDVNDIGLLKLEYPVPFTDNVKPLCLPAEGLNHTNLKVKVLGWGVQNSRGKASDVLKETSLKMLSLRECKSSPLGKLISDSMLCTFRKSTDACQGDSGGPLLHEKPNRKYEVIGIVSWGIGCASDLPGVFTNVLAFKEWIKTRTRDGVYCAGS